MGQPQRNSALAKALVIAIVTAMAVVGTPLATPAAAETARELITEAKRLSDTDRLWTDRTQKLVLEIEDSRGSKRRRELEMKTLRGKDGEDKTLTVFLSPGEVRGTSFLQFSHKDRDAEQWLYLPALGRTRQITSTAKDQSFVGTDFSYRDLELLTDVLEWSEDEARSNLLRSETVDGVDLAVIELVPLHKDVGYKRLVVALSRPDLMIRRMEFYRDDPAPKKILQLGRIEDVGAIPTARRLEMAQPAAGTRTVVDVTDVRYDQGLKANLFTQDSLERAGEEAG
jgi:Outer membrane lipoprotein-sorting protein